VWSEKILGLHGCWLGCAWQRSIAARSAYGIAVELTQQHRFSLLLRAGA